MPPLQRDAARRLVCGPIEGVYEYEDSAIERILQYARGYPYQIQQVCFNLIERIRDRGRSRATSDDVESVITDLENRAAGEAG